MEKNYKLQGVAPVFSFFLVLQIIFIFCPAFVKAQSMLGAEFNYEYGTDDSLAITLTTYSYCDANPHPLPKILVTDSHFVQNLIPTLISSEDITPLCTSLESKCKNPNSTFPYGILRNIYKGKIYRGDFGCEVFISWNGGKRASGIKNIAPGQDLYIEAGLNNCKKLTSHSPVFDFQPITNVYTKHVIALYQSAQDEDGDSLVYKLIAPKQFADSGVNFISGYNYLRPFGDSINFTYNLNTGLVSFKDTVPGIIAVAYKIEEWAKDYFGKPYLKGEITRDVVTIITENTGQYPPKLTGIAGTPNSTEIFASNWKKCFSIRSLDPNIKDTVKLKWNNGIKGAEFTTELYRKNPYATFCWKPPQIPNGTTQFNYFIITATDNGCPLRCVAQRRFEITNLGNPKADAGEDVFSCIGDTVQLLGKGGDKFNWWPKEGLSSTTIANPRAFPKVTTTYKLRIINAAGYSDIDSVTVYVYGDCVWPGETNKKGVVDMKDILPVGVAFGKTGFRRPNASDEWRAHYGVDWNTEFNKDINNKHQDCNGDGKVDFTDANVVLKNYTKKPDPSLLFQNGNIDDPEFGLVPDKQVYQEGENAFVKIYLGTNSLPAADMYGIALRFKYDAILVDSGSFSLDASNSWLVNSANGDIAFIKDFPRNGIVDVGLCGINHLAKDGNGEIAKLKFKFVDNIGVKFPFKLQLLDAKFINAGYTDKPVFMAKQQETIFVGKDADTSSGNANNGNNNNNNQNPGTDSTSKNNNNNSGNNEIKLYPNPANKVLVVVDENQDISQIQLFNALGQLVFENFPLPSKEHKINIETLSSGVYFVLIATPDGIKTKAFIIIR